MSHSLDPTSLRDLPVHFVGIKGTGMCALAEVFLHRGAGVSGSDSPETFYTDAILSELEIPVFEEFRRENLGQEIRLVVYSAAYNPEANPELIEARQRNIPLLSYPEALGALSKSFYSSAVAGVHGKTTTTALAGALAKSLDLPASVIVGSAVADFGGRSTWTGGDRFLIAETCEYRRHFLNYFPAIVILTSLEADHLDYYHDADDLEKAFFEFLDKVPSSGHIIYCADDKGTLSLINKFHTVKPAVNLIPYGRAAEGKYQLREHRQSQGVNNFKLAGFEEIFHLPLPGYHIALDASAAIALSELLLSYDGLDLDASKIDLIKTGLSQFRGSKRRSEMLGEARGILFLDDYAHHPTAIKTTLRGYREYYPDRRLVVDFMSHTYSRTEALLDDFAEAFSDADEVILHEIYASAREQNTSGISGERLYREVVKNHPSVRYYPAVMDAKDYCLQTLESGNIFVTMGAGDNWKLGKVLLEEFQNEEGELP